MNQGKKRMCALCYNINQGMQSMEWKIREIYLTACSQSAIHAHAAGLSSLSGSPIYILSVQTRNVE